ncbi:MAG: hypothetical protein K0R34_1251 [Herbinix sp.]|jgi:hypothetical protein|nr:hypothetical protein [Herbinix sp.]
MLKKALQLLKKNPIIILCYAVFLAINILLIFFLYPKSFGADTYTKDGMLDYSLYMATMRNILIALLLVFIISLFYISGFYNMIREAVFSGKTRLYSFLDGIKKYLGRVILSVLLTAAIVIVGSILLGLLSIPFTIMAVSNGTGSLLVITLVIMLFTLLLVIIPTPFIVLWLPALFLEDTGVIRSLKLGAKAGARNYWRLLLASFILVLPQAIYSILNYNVMMRGSLFTAGYYGLLGIMAILSLVYNVYAFIIYHEYRNGLITIQQQQEEIIKPSLEELE